jgi:hypothetical protein
VAASTAAAVHLDRVATTGTVLLSGRLAAYLAVAGEVLAVVSGEAAAPPVSVVLPPGTRPDDVLAPGDQVLAGGGCLVVRPEGPEPILLTPTRWWEPARVRTGRVDPAALTAFEGALAALAEPPAAVARARVAGSRAAKALVAGSADSADSAAAELCDVLGLGPGTTPSGDDVTAGVLLAAHAMLPPPWRATTDRLAAAVLETAATRTGCVSGSMLAQAGLGRGTAVVVRAVDALAGHGDAVCAVDALLDLGHHSGVDLACGAMAVAFEVARSPLLAGSTR